jgi:pyruvate dehydrogenase E2 component (dihydrolipoamide acetyltransferase)
MSVSVVMPQLGESVTEGTVTRWLKREGERIEADEPLLEVSTDKVDTEIPSPVSGTLRGITVAEDETVAVGAELAVIDEEGAAPAAEPAAGGPAQQAPPQQEAPAEPAPAAAAQAPPAPAPPAPPAAEPAPPAAPEPAYQETSYPEPTGYQQPSYQQPGADQSYAAPPSAYQQPAGYQEPSYPEPPSYQQHPYPEPPAYQPPPATAPQPGYPAAPQSPEQPPAPAGQAAADGAAQRGPADGPYVTPLVRKLAAEHGIDLGSVAGTGVGGRIRKQDVLDAARDRRSAAQPPAAQPPQAAAQPPQAPAQPPQAPAQPPQGPPAVPGQAAPAAPAPAGQAGPGRAPRPTIVPSSQRGTTERMSRPRQLIAQRMVESLHTSAQLTTVVEADVTAIARLRDRAKAAFAAREGVKLSYLPFFALATVEALKVHPKLNAVIDTASSEVTYHDAEHLGIAVDTERGLMVPVIRGAGDLNIAGLARKIADIAERTRAGRVSPDDLSGGTFTLTNTGSRGALFDTPIINQPQVGILGTGTVVKRAIVVDDPALGEVITVRSMVYLALTYDHRLVDGADAARFLLTMKTRLEEGAFETELGL